MQAALDPAAHRILGLNEVGHESGTAAFCEGRDLPWLQDTADAGVWQEWGVVYRDVVILDADGEAVEVYNLTENDLADPDRYQELLALIEGAGG